MTDLDIITHTSFSRQTSFYLLHRETTTLSEADEFHLPLKLITSRYAALLALQQGAQYSDIFLLIDFIEHALLNVATNALCPKCLLNLATSPLVILDFVVDDIKI